MTLDQLTALADIHGGDLDRWPQDQRLAAQALVLNSPAAAAVLARSLALTRRLDDWRLPAASSELRAAILATAPQSAPTRSEVGRKAWLWLSGAGLASAAAGIACGALFATTTLADARDEAVVAAMTAEPGVVNATPADVRLGL